MAVPLPRTTRTRVLLGALVLLAATIVLTIAAVRTLLLARLHERIDVDLAQEVEELERLAQGTDPATGEPFGPDLRAVLDAHFDRTVVDREEVQLGIVGDRPYLRSGGAAYPVEELDELVASWASATEPAYATSPTPVGELRSLVVPVARPDGTTAGTFVAARFPAGDLDEVAEVVQVTASVGFVAFVLASAAAWAIAGRVLAPLGALGDLATSVRADDLDRRIEVRGTGELADLSRTVNGMLDRLQGAMTTQRAFLDDAGHELRTPITIVRGHLEVVPDGEPLPTASREVVLDELDRMARIVDDLLAVAKAEQPDFVRTGPVDVADLTEEVGARARTLGDRAWSVDPGAVVVAELDRDRVVQAWMNLVRNAVQHTAPGDDIRIGSRVEGRAGPEPVVVLEVVDHGEGVAPADRERIFERFARGTSSRRTRSDGAGLGLAIVRAVAQAHGGDVRLRDTPGGGATFALVLPAVEAPRPGVPSDSASPSGSAPPSGPARPAAPDATGSQEVPWPAS